MMPSTDVVTSSTGTKVTQKVNESEPKATEQLQKIANSPALEHFDKN